jgi:hypothetical protein
MGYRGGKLGIWGGYGCKQQNMHFEMKPLNSCNGHIYNFHALIY